MDLEGKSRDELKEIADAYGIKYSPNIGENTLRERLMERLGDIDDNNPLAMPDEEYEDSPLPGDEAELNLQPSEEPRKRTGFDLDPGLAKRQKVLKQMMKLVRCRISPFDPQFKDWPGIILEAGNRIHKEKRYIPFNKDWHVPQVLYDVLKNKKYRRRIERKDPATGKPIYEQVMEPAYNIEVLPPLTKEELEEIRRNRAARGG